MNIEDQIIKTLKQNEKPMSAGQLADKTGLERKVVDKAMSNLKKRSRSVGFTESDIKMERG